MKSRDLPLNPPKVKLFAGGSTATKKGGKESDARSDPPKVRASEKEKNTTTRKAADGRERSSLKEDGSSELLQWESEPSGLPVETPKSDIGEKKKRDLRRFSSWCASVLAVRLPLDSNMP